MRIATGESVIYRYSMLAIQLDPETEKRLERMAKLTGRTQTSYAQQAITELLDDLEDIQIATERLQSLGKTYSAEEVKRELGL